MEPMVITRITPIAATEKHTETGKNTRFAYGVSEMQGWRLSMFFYYSPLRSSVMVATRTLFISRKKPSKFIVSFMIP
jgi:hypothetical protein